MMPPEGDRLTREEIAVVVQWIQDGAKWPENSVSKHWSYIAPVRPSLPKVEPLVKLRNEIDYFVAKAISESGIDSFRHRVERSNASAGFSGVNGDSSRS